MLAQARWLSGVSSSETEGEQARERALNMAPVGGNVLERGRR
jgi:hypothetical protein